MKKCFSDSQTVKKGVLFILYDGALWVLSYKNLKVFRDDAKFFSR